MEHAAGNHVFYEHMQAEMRRKKSLQKAGKQCMRKLAQALQISARKIRNLLRSRKFSHGGATRRFSESVRDFKSFLDTLDGSMLSVPVL